MVEAYESRPGTRGCDRLVYLLKRLQKVLARADKGARGVPGGGGCLGGRSIGGFFRAGRRGRRPGKELPLFLIRVSTESREHLFVSIGEIAELGKCSFERHEIGF